MQGKHGAQMSQELERQANLVSELHSSPTDVFPSSSFYSNESDNIEENSTDCIIKRLNETGTIDAGLDGSERELDGMNRKSGSLASTEKIERKDEDNVEHEVWFDHHNCLTPVGKDDDEDEDALAYRMHRQDYYARKLKIDIRGDSNRTSETFMEAALFPICQQYIKTLQWVLSYYFKSVADWSYYYPYHYAPFASDLLIFTKHFAKDCADHNKMNDWTNFLPCTKPLLPFEQQMFIMPAMSANIVPQPYRWLLAPSGSPVSEFFPDEFETDINGKLAGWEAVVLIPFIDEAKMLAAMEPCTKLLSPEDSKRNVHRGHFILRVRDREGVDYPATFESLVSEEVDFEFFRTHILRDLEQRFKVWYQVPRHVDLVFPSLYRIPFTYKIARVGVRTFSFPSKGESVLLTVKHPSGRSASSLGSLKSVADSYLGRAILTGWPYSRLVVPFALMDENEIWELDMKAGTSNESSREAMLVVERTSLREHSEAPFWTSMRWLHSQAEYSISRLRDFCAITFAGEEPRAALLCLPPSNCVFSVVISESDPSQVGLRPLLMHVAPLLKQPTAPRTLRRRHTPLQANKRSLCSDANVSIEIGGEASLEILDLTIDPSTTPFVRSLLDVFRLASKALIFTQREDRCFGRVGEIVGSTTDNKLTIQLFPDPPLAEDPSLFSAAALDADESSYLTPIQISQELRLTQHIIHRIIGNFMVRVPPSPDSIKHRRSRDGVLERSNLANIGLSLIPHCKRACIVGWSRYSKSKKMWVFSPRTVSAIAKYNQLFPTVVNFIGASNMKIPAFEMSDIFPINTFEKYSELRTFLRSEGKGNRIVTDTNAPPLDTEGLSIVKNRLPSDACFRMSSSRECPCIEIAPTDVFAILPDGGRVVPQGYQAWLKRLGKKLETFELLDRVMYVGPQRDIFGLCGFVVGVYLVLVVASSHLLHYPRFAKSTQNETTNPISAKDQKESNIIGKRQQHLGKALVKKEMSSSDSLLPPEWLAKPPSEFASPSTTIPASNVKSTKHVSASKNPLSQTLPPPMKHSNLNATPSLLGRLPVQSCPQSSQHPQNRQEKHQLRHIPTTADQTVASPHLLQPSSVPIIYPTSEAQLPPNPQAPTLFPPSTWCLSSPGWCPETCPSQSEQNSEVSPLWAPVDPRFVAYWHNDGSLVFVDSATNQVLSVEQLRDLYFPFGQQPLQLTQSPEYFAPQQLHLQSITPSVNDSHLSMAAQLPADFVFLPL
ncbi:unnamed protein product [Hydatigera taeniaeformis]|uniref:AAA domain-containing protein n=1 Tax=Hydatigena taeniaeformis TaxID=6205 RepID=A0A0R3X801_HYDTA|nr:unnamed protein product [Hydatigera taeniaeformis]